MWACAFVGALGNTLSFIDLSVRNSDGVGGKYVSCVIHGIRSI